VVTTLVCLIYFAREAAGASNTRLSLRPLIFLGEPIMHRSGNSRRENAKVCLMNASAPHTESSSPATGSAQRAAR